MQGDGPNMICDLFEFSNSLAALWVFLQLSKA
jgi:hypothetical protein